MLPEPSCASISGRGQQGWSLPSPAKRWADRMLIQISSKFLKLVVFWNPQDLLLLMDTQIFKIDASWAEKLTKTRVSFLLTPSVDWWTGNRNFHMIVILVTHILTANNKDMRRSQITHFRCLPIANFISNFCNCSKILFGLLKRPTNSNFNIWMRLGGGGHNTWGCWLASQAWCDTGLSL